MLAAMRYAALLFAACASVPKPPSAAIDDLPVRFDDLTQVVMQHIFQIEPGDAVGLGLHEYDGVLPDRSAAGIAQAIAQLQKDRAALEGLAPSTLSGGQREEQGVLLQTVRERLFTLVDLDAYHTNPMVYANAINLDGYIVRDYAPVAQRAAAVVAMCKALPAYLAQARTSLKTPMPRTWIDTALLQFNGYAEFVDHDIRAELAKASPPLANAAETTAALDACKATLADHAAWLVQQQPQGTGQFALGEARFLKMLADTQGVATDLAHLQAIVDADLGRNTAAIEEAARAIDPNRPVRDVVAAAAEDRPAASQVLDIATGQVEMLRAFIIDHRIVSIPADDVAAVRESPAFQRWNLAFLNGPGPFEQVKLPSYYYISPPDPSWSAAEQRAYVPPRADLMFTTVHEVYPGHFIHDLHIRKNPSRVMQSFWSYSTGEGWAHYAEEMMYDAGVGDHQPAARIGMLKEALLRDVRFLVALGEHTGKLTVDQATQLFQDKAFTDPGNARQQAVRGTFDPMFLSYTLGKLMIRKLHDDWQKLHPQASLGEFHDEFLSHACAPLPVTRAAMLGPDAGPAI
jgi:uncharacterized protein (DUF885 family)